MSKRRSRNESISVGLSIAAIFVTSLVVCVCIASMVTLWAIISNRNISAETISRPLPPPTLDRLPTVTPTQGAALSPQPENSPAPLDDAQTATSVATQSPPTPTLPPPPTPVPTSTPEPSPTNTPLPPPTKTPTPLPTNTPLPPSPTPTPVKIEHVVIISVDGLRPEPLGNIDIAPTLFNLQIGGAYSAKAQTVPPNATLIAHASMLGGMKPEQHGIYWNQHAPELGKIKGPTLFSVAHDAGLSTAMVVGKEKLDHLNLPGSVDHWWAGGSDLEVKNHALELVRGGLPNVLFVHFPEVDWEGHNTGWLGPGQLEVIKRVDSYIGEIVAELNTGGYLTTNTLLIVTSDHGGSGTSHYTDSPDDTTIPWLAYGPAVGVAQGLTLERPIEIYDTAATALFAFKIPTPAEWAGAGEPVFEILPERLSQ